MIHGLSILERCGHRMLVCKIAVFGFVVLAILTEWIKMTIENDSKLATDMYFGHYPNWFYCYCILVVTEVILVIVSVFWFLFLRN